MLQLTGHSNLIETDAQSALADSGFEPLTALRLNWPILLVSTLLALAVALTVIAASEPVYVASARVLFDPRHSETIRPANDREMLQYSLDAAQLESQIQLLKSEQVSRAVIEAHALEQDPEFASSRFSLRGWVRSWLTPESGPKPRQYNAISNAFDSRLEIRRLSQSYVLQVSFYSTDPEKAAKLANAATAAYIGRQLKSKIEVAERSSQFERQIRELTEEGEAAAEAVRTGVIDIDAFPGAEARVISTALTPLGPSAPRSSLILAFALSLGLLFGGSLALIRHNRRRPVSLRAHVEQLLGVNYLGSLRMLGRNGWRRERLHTLDGWGASQAAGCATDRACTELRAIRTCFETMSGHRSGQCVALTSAKAGEGKSLIAHGLAISFAAAGRSTLLIDANPRNPTLTRRLEALGANGFVQVLRGECPSTAVCPTLAQNLFFMPIGRDSERISLSDMFDTPAAREIFKLLREKYDRVVIDLSDFSSLPDAWALGDIVDSYVIVVRAGHTPQREASQMISALKFASAGIAGVVLNQHRA